MYAEEHIPDSLTVLALNHLCSEENCFLNIKNPNIAHGANPQWLGHARKCTRCFVAGKGSSPLFAYKC